MPHVTVPTELTDDWERNRTARRTRILQTLKLGFAVGKVAERWDEEFRWLFDLRDGVVHARKGWQALRPHPVGGSMAPDHVMYSVESSGRAVDVALDVLATCFALPKPNDGGLSGYLIMFRDVPPRLRQRRDGTGA